VRRLSIVNRGTRPREIEVTSYAEIALARPEDDLAHPAFGKLFIETEYDAQSAGLLFSRRPRSADEAPAWAFHVLAVDGRLAKQCEFCYELRLHRARGYGALKAILDILAHEEPMTLTELVNAAVELCRPTIAAAQHTLTISLPDEPVRLHADAVRLTQVLVNLLGNALAESGVPGYEVSAWFGLFAPARTPARVIDALHVEARKALLNPDIVRRMDADGTEVVGNLPREFATDVKAEFERWRALVQRAQLKL